MLRAGLRPVIGTDNVALIEPDPWGEIRFLRYAMAGSAVLRPVDLLKMVTSWAWSWGFGYVLREGLLMRGIAVGVAYEDLSADYIYDYLVTRASTSDIIYVIDGPEIVRVAD
jgi:cytosine/adenosine deaminase-related metal-dependent hydrolase